MTAWNNILLTGAGFSRNWGGWLASEAFEYLIGCRGLNAVALQMLWHHKDRGGFEAALAALQGDARTSKAATSLEAAISGMFHDMNTAFADTDLTFSGGEVDALETFPTRFNAIFTLNQDTLLERHYLNDNVCLLSNRRWDGWTLPGLTPVADPMGSPLTPATVKDWTPAVPPFKVDARCQPYFKLHGSSNWLAAGAGGGTRQLLVLGGNKSKSITDAPLLKWYHEQFAEMLAKPSTRLLIIGYGFGDDHINATLKTSAEGGARMFVVDPNGVDVMDSNRHIRAQGGIYAPGDLAKALWPAVDGASRRTLREIFGRDAAERQKLMRFFS